MPGSPFVIYDGDSVIRLTGTITGVGGGTAPQTLTGTDPTKFVLKLVAASGQSALIFRLEDSSGTLLADFDPNGKFDVTSFNVQVPPDTGGGVGTAVTSVQPAHVTLLQEDAQSGDVLTAQDYGPGPSFAPETFLRIRSSGHGDLLEITPTVDSDVPLQIIESPAPSANQIEVWDNPFNTLLFAISKGGGVLFPAADPHVVGAWWDNAGVLTRSAG